MRGTAVDGGAVGCGLRDSHGRGVQGGGMRAGELHSDTGEGRRPGGSMQGAGHKRHGAGWGGGADAAKATGGRAATLELLRWNHVAFNGCE